jgi:hypothetical protein
VKLAFTICSNNYLAQAKSLGDSLILHNADYVFIIGLVDQKSSNIEYDFFRPHIILPIEDIRIENFEEIWKKYDIVELNTAVKPSLFKYIFAKYPGVTSLFYFDPDILIYDSLDNLEAEFSLADILLTPHILSPIEPNTSKREVPTESTFLNYGLYNLGFIGLKKGTVNTDAFLNWWEKRTLYQGFINVCDGIFVDQLWVNLAPIFFERVKILKEMGYNAAPWNLHERGHIVERNGQYFLPDQSILVFYHFSSYKYLNPELIARSYNRYQFSDLPEIKPLYNQYHELLILNKIDIFSHHPCYYVQIRQEYLARLKREAERKGIIRKKLKNAAREMTPPIIWDGLRKMILKNKVLNTGNNL